MLCFEFVVQGNWSTRSSTTSASAGPPLWIWHCHLHDPWGHETRCVQQSLRYLTTIAWASFGDVALLNLVIIIGSLEISTGCLRAFPEFIVLTEKRAYLLSNWQKKHSTFDKRSVADLVNGFDVPGISVSISKVDLLWPRLFIAYCPVVAKCSKRSLTRCNSSDLSHKNSNFDAMLLFCQPAFLWYILWDVFELQHIDHYVHWLVPPVRQVFSGRILSWNSEQLPLYWCYSPDRGCIVSSQQAPLSCCHPSWSEVSRV